MYHISSNRSLLQNRGLGKQSQIANRGLLSTPFTFNYMYCVATAVYTSKCLLIKYKSFKTQPSKAAARV